MTWLSNDWQKDAPLFLNYVSKLHHNINEVELY